MARTSPNEELQQAVDSLSQTIVKLDQKIDSVTREPAKGADTKAVPTNATPWATISAFVVGNLAVLGAFGTFLWTELTDVAEKTAQKTATAEARSATKTYLADDPSIRSLAKNATNTMLTDMRMNMEDFRNQERQIVHTLGESLARQEFLKQQANSLKKEIADQSRLFTETTKSILSDIANGTNALTEIKRKIEDGKLLKRAEDLRSDLLKTSDQVDTLVKNSQTQIQTAKKTVTDFAEKLRGMADELTDKMKKDILENAQLREQVVRNAARQLSRPGALDDVLVRQLDSKVSDTSDKYTVAQRAQALQLMAIFASERLLRSKIVDVIAAEPDKNADLLEIALNSYPPSNTIADNEEVLQLVLKRLASSNLQATNLGQAYEHFLSRLPKGHAPQIEKWLGTEVPAKAREVAFTGLAKIGGDETLRSLIRLAKQTNPAISEFGWRYLARVRQDSLTERTRKSALVDIWSTIQNAIRGAEVAHSHEMDIRTYIKKIRTGLANSNYAQVETLLSLPVTSGILVEYNSQLRKAIELNDVGELRYLTKIYSMSAFTNAVLETSESSVANDLKNLAFFNLLAISDWGDLISDKFWPADAKTTTKHGERIAAKLMEHWVNLLLRKQGTIGTSRLELHASNIFKHLMNHENIYKMRELDSALAFSIRHGEKLSYVSFLNRFGDGLTNRKRSPVHKDFALHEALRASLDRDEKNKENSYGELKPLLVKATSEKTLHPELSQALLKALGRHSQHQEIRDFLLHMAVRNASNPSGAHLISDAIQAFASLDSDAKRLDVSGHILDIFANLFSANSETHSGKNIQTQIDPEILSQVGITIIEKIVNYISNMNKKRDIIQLIHKKIGSGLRINYDAIDESAKRRFSNTIASEATTNLGLQSAMLIEVYTLAIGLDPKNAEAYNRRCWQKVLNGQPSHALNDCNESLRLRPQDAATHDSRAFAHWSRKNYDAARRDIEEARNIDPSDEDFTEPTTRFKEYSKLLSARKNEQ